MKKIIATLTVIAFTTQISGCSTNTTAQNTAVGAGTGAVAGGLLGSLASGAGSGWVIAGGAVLGALIGGAIGNNVDNTDKTNMNAALDNNGINEPSNWKNVSTGATYKVIPTSDFFTYKGNPNCRHYIAYGMHDGQTSKTRGIACRMADGYWQQVK